MRGATSGTTIESPGLNPTLSGSPDQNSELFFAASTDPSEASQRHSLYRGQPGIAVLAADLEHPAAAAMPLFGDERWAVR